QAGDIAADAAPLFERLLALLARFGEASETGGEWQVGASSELPAFAEVWRLLLAEGPELVAELALAAVAAAKVPDLLASGLGAADTAAAPMIAQLLYGSPVSRAGIDAVAVALRETAAAWPDGRPLRVLEVGADAGSTGRLLAQLSQTGAA